MVEGSWSSTISRASLALTANTPAFGYSYEFQLPTVPFCLKVLSINDIVPGTEDYRIEGDKLLADVNTMKIKYVGRVTDTQSYDVFLRNAITTKLTAELAYPITGSQSTANAWAKKYEIDLFNGLAEDGKQGSSQQLVSNDLTEVR